MGKLGFNNDDTNQQKRWEKIMALPESAEFYDRSTGKKYRRGMFRPIYQSTSSQVVDTFQIIGTTDTVHIPLLRLVGDYTRCSLMKDD